MRQIAIASLVALWAALPVGAQEAADGYAPEGAVVGKGTGQNNGQNAGQRAAESPAVVAALAAKARNQPVVGEKWMVSAANPLAAQAGASVLRRGGSAADAMVAVQSVLGLVEPQSSGLGGGAFLVWYDAKTGELTTLDGRETAPIAATPTLFQTEDGAPMGFFDAVVGGRSVGTPGTPALMEMAHRKWGRAPWSQLFDAATRLADKGFDVSPRLAGLVQRDADRLSVHPETAAYFLPDGQPLQAGQRLRNPAYGDTLRILAAQGASAFYTGPIAADVVRAVQTGDNPGVLSAMDLALYQVKERDPVCARYRIYQVCGMGPPSSGALTVGQILGILEPFNLPALGAHDPQIWRLIGDASRLAFADRGRYMADSDFVPVPVRGLLDPDYLRARGKGLYRPTALPEVQAGRPEFDHALHRADDESIELPSTSHISIVDRYGNVLSMTTTIENAFGSRVMARGFLLNNELTDFSFRTHRDGVMIANRLEPGKRPRSSMAPTIVMQDGRPVLAIGSPGGSRIIGYVVQAIIAWADWGYNIQHAVAMPHVVNRFGTYDVEAGTDAVHLTGLLQQMGYEVNQRDLNSGLQAIEIGEVLRGAADPRREGIALGK